MRLLHVYSTLAKDLERRGGRREDKEREREKSGIEGRREREKVGREGGTGREREREREEEEKEEEEEERGSCLYTNN